MLNHAGKRNRKNDLLLAARSILSMPGDTGDKAMKAEARSQMDLLYHD
jgi:hypothetical protein